MRLMDTGARVAPNKSLLQPTPAGMVRRLAWPLALACLACGSEVVTPQGAGGGGSAGSTSASSSTGGAGGAWASGGGGGAASGGAGASDCPDGLHPAEGSGCSKPGLECDYSAANACGTSFHAVCVGEHWVVTSNSPSCADFVCPEWPDEAFIESSCDPCCQHGCMDGESCSYYDADCVDGAWFITYTPC
jgi:hypothetical protein